MKAITPVIATVMLMLITVGMVGMTYTWFSNMMTTQTEKNIAIPVGGIQCINNRISAIVTNVGANSNITDDDIVVADVNGVSVKNTPFFGGFNVNGLVGYWRFEQSNGSAATNDSSGYGNMGTLTNMNLTGNASSGLTQGRFGNGLQFDGVNDYVNAGDGATLNFGTSVFTMAAWVYKIPGDYFPSNVVVSKGSERCLWSSASQQEGYMLGVDSVQRVAVGLAGTTGSCYLSTGAITSSAWQHIAAVVTGTNLKIYINGALDSSQTVLNNNKDTAYAFVVGNGKALDYTTFFNGAIDEVMIWNRVLAQDEITQLNKTNSGNFTLAPNKAVTLIKGYLVFSKGKYTVRVGTRNGVMERMVECL